MDIFASLFEAYACFWLKCSPWCQRVQGQVWCEGDLVWTSVDWRHGGPMHEVEWQLYLGVQELWRWAVVVVLMVLDWVMVRGRAIRHCGSGIWIAWTDDECAGESGWVGVGVWSSTRNRHAPLSNAPECIRTRRTVYWCACVRSDVFRERKRQPIRLRRYLRGPEDCSIVPSWTRMSRWVSFVLIWSARVWRWWRAVKCRRILLWPFMDQSLSHPPSDFSSPHSRQTGASALPDHPTVYRCHCQTTWNTNKPLICVDWLFAATWLFIASWLNIINKVRKLNWAK